MSKTVELYLCEGCGKPILRPEDGVVVHGNIYVADTGIRGGLVGNNFPTNHSIDEMISLTHLVDKVKETAYCVPCFLSIVLTNANLTTTR